MSRKRHYHLTLHPFIQPSATDTASSSLYITTTHIITIIIILSLQHVQKHSTSMFTSSFHSTPISLSLSLLLENCSCHPNYLSIITTNKILLFIEIKSVSSLFAFHSTLFSSSSRNLLLLFGDKTTRL